MSDNTKPTENQEGNPSENSQDTTPETQPNTQDEPQEESPEEITSTEEENKTSPTEENEDHHHKEIENANAEESEDKDNVSRHQILIKDYEAMSIDELVLELNSLLKNEKVQNIREHVNQIKIEFDKMFNEIIEEKKEEFLEEGGNIIDFHYTSPIKKKFYQTYFDYREKRDKYYTQLK
ncbi:MAG: DUF349 domain-containing protein, partial [Psychroflexus sp.]|nr:DUF349 domain-containing protein [Psychroflexus sp.]